MSDKAIAIAMSQISNALEIRFPNFEKEQICELAKNIVELIDWNDSALMHKDLRWIANFFADQLVVK